jgi:predicted dehydrogenase
MKKINYKPRDPEGPQKGIGIIGCGGIVASHLAAYKKANYKIEAMADINIDNLHDRSSQVPGVKTFTDYRQLLKLPEVKVVDIATHPGERVHLIREALNSGKHVLSQKPFVLDLKVGEELVKLAEKKNLLLAVNQNGRWNPPWNYAFHVIQTGMLGKVMSVHMRCHWDHNWIKNNPKFNELQHIILYDYGIHWFDILTVWMGNQQAKRVFASIAKAPDQKAAPPLLAQVLLEYEMSQASLVFDGSQRVGGEFSFFIGGTKGSIFCTGPDINHHILEVRTREGIYRPHLQGSWFPDGFHGTMGELLCAIEEKRIPWNNASDNLKSLRLCFSACASADKGKAVNPATVNKIQL